MHVTKTTRAHYYWWIKYWRFSLEIANRQSLLLANISSYTVYRTYLLKVPHEQSAVVPTLVPPIYP